jgi:hypothetical protein
VDWWGVVFICKGLWVFCEGRRGRWMERFVGGLDWGIRGYRLYVCACACACVENGYCRFMTEGEIGRWRILGWLG